MFTRKTKRERQARAWQERLVVGGNGEVEHVARKSRWWWLWGAWLLMVVTLTGRLVQLQVVEGSYHRARAEENRVLVRRIAAARGILYDRHGKVLVRNVPHYKRLTEGAVLGAGTFEEIDRDEALSMGVTGSDLVFFDVGREYIQGRAMAPLLGYVGEVTGDELIAERTYVGGDVIGRGGIEGLFDKQLRGVPGYELLEVDSTGEVIRHVGEQEPVAGADITLTIDAGLQQELYDAMEDYTGAAVASDPRTGEILALVSRPAFDPNAIATSLTEEGEPFFNRAIGGAYPPGSVFKIITAVAALEEGVIDPDYTVQDEGEIRIDEYRYGNWYFDQYGRTEGEVNLVKGLQRSNDIYFYRIGELVGAEAIAKWAELFGLGRLTGIAIAGEVPGLVPNPEWKERYTGSRWFLGNTYHYAIGQGDLQVTPLQMNTAVGVIANQGKLCRPTLLPVKGVGDCADLSIQLETIEAVAEGMKAACAPGGTAFPFFDFQPAVACKTGTAQFGDPEDRTHAWLSVYAPAEKPEIMLTVLLEKAGEGSAEAGPVARTALDYWFSESRAQ